MKDYGWGLFRKGLKRRSKEVRRMRIMTCLAVFFLAFTLLLQDILSAYRMEMNYRSFGSWAVRSEDTTYEGNGALRPCGIISRGSMLYDLYPRATDIDPETEEPYGETRFDVEVKDSITVGILDTSRSSDMAIGAFSEGLAESQHIGLYEGRWPEADDEIAMELAALEKLGVSYELGQEVSFYIADHDDVKLINEECQRLYDEACAKWLAEHPGENPPEEGDTGDEFDVDDDDGGDIGMSGSTGEDEPDESGYPQRSRYSPEMVYECKTLTRVTFKLVGTVERYSLRWDGSFDMMGRVDLPSAIITNSAFDKLNMDKVEHRLYELSPDMKSGRVWETAGKLFDNFEGTYSSRGVPCVFNRSAYNNPLWGNSTVFREMTLLLIVLSSCIIAYLMASYLGKRRQYFIRMREIGASTGEVWRMAAYECVLSVLPAALVTFAAAYVCGALAVLIVSLVTNIRFFFPVRVGTMLLIICSAAATLALSLLAALVIFMGRGVARKSRAISRASVRGLRRRSRSVSRSGRAYLGLRETLKRDRRTHRIKTWALRIVSVLVCAAIIFCFVNVYNSARNYKFIRSSYPDYYVSQEGIYNKKGSVPITDKNGKHISKSETTYGGTGGCFTLKTTLPEAFVKEVESLPGVRSVKWVGTDDANAHINWEGKAEDAFFNECLIWYFTEYNPYRYRGEFDPEYGAERYMNTFETDLFYTYGDSEPEKLWNKYKDYLDPKVADKEAFLRGEQVIVAVDKTMELLKYSGAMRLDGYDIRTNEAGTDLWEQYGHSFEPGESISLGYLDTEVEATIAGIIPMELAPRRTLAPIHNGKLLAVIGSDGFLARVAESIDHETGYNTAYILLNEISVNESTVKSLSGVCAKYNVGYGNYLELKLEQRQEFTRSLATYGFFGLVLTVLFLFVISSVHRDEEARLEQKYGILRRAGMTVSSLKKQKCADAALQTLWLLPALLIHGLLTVLMWGYTSVIFESEQGSVLSSLKLMFKSEKGSVISSDLMPFIKSVITPQVAVPCLLALMIACWHINKKLILNGSDPRELG